MPTGTQARRAPRSLSRRRRRRATTASPARSTSAAPRPGRRRPDSSSATPGTETGEPASIRVPDLDSPIGRTLWWRWTAPSTGPFVFDTAGSSIDTLLAVYQGTALANLQLVGSAEDSDDLRTSRAGFDAVGGTTYFVQVGTSGGGDGGAISLGWKANPRTNDTFADRATISGLTGTVSSTNAGATLDPNEPSDSWSLDSSVWYAWTPGEGDAALTFGDGNTYPGWLTVYTGTTLVNLQTVGSDTGDPALSVSFHAQAGKTYLIQVGIDSDDPGGTFSLDWALTQPPGAPSLDRRKPVRRRRRTHVERSRADGGPRSRTTTSTAARRAGRGAADDGRRCDDYDDSAVVNGTTYYYEVAAVNSFGTGSPSNEISATPLGSPGAPTLDLATGATNSVTARVGCAGVRRRLADHELHIYRGTAPAARRF